MIPIHVERESETTVGRYSVLTVRDATDKQRVIGSDYTLPIIENNHLRLHEGRAFNVYKLMPPSDGLAQNANMDIVLTSNVGVYPHVIVQASCSQNAIISWHENVTNIVGGDIFVPINRNRASSNVSQVGALIGPTSLTLNGVIHQEYISAGDDKKASGGGAYSFEFVLDDDTSYLFRLTNVGSASAAAYMSLEWYE
jgi:hypothetical protein